MEKLFSKSNILNKLGLFPLKFNPEIKEFEFSRLEYVKFFFMILLAHLHSINFALVWSLYGSDITVNEILTKTGRTSKTKTMKHIYRQSITHYLKTVTNYNYSFLLENVMNYITITLFKNVNRYFHCILIDYEKFPRFELYS